MSEEIGKVAGASWHALDEKGEMTLTQLKKQVDAKAPLFDWAVGWLAREDKIVLTRVKKSFRLSLKGWQGQTANAA